jgi:hypothetical protein
MGEEQGSSVKAIEEAGYGEFAGPAGQQTTSVRDSPQEK